MVYSISLSLTVGLANLNQVSSRPSDSPSTVTMTASVNHVVVSPFLTHVSPARAFLLKQSFVLRQIGNGPDASGGSVIF